MRARTRVRARARARARVPVRASGQHAFRGEALALRGRLAVLQLTRARRGDNHLVRARARARVRVR